MDADGALPPELVGKGRARRPKGSTAALTADKSGLRPGISHIIQRSR